MVRIERGRAGKAVAMDQQQDLVVLGHGALASRQHEFTHVQSDARIKLVFGIEGFSAGVADEIVSHSNTVSVIGPGRMKSHQDPKKTVTQKPSSHDA